MLDVFDMSNWFGPRLSISANGRLVGFDKFYDWKSIKANPTDLKIQAKPTHFTSLKKGNLGNYSFVVSNMGVNPVYPLITHVVDNGLVIGIAPSQGLRSAPTVINVCRVGRLEPGKSMTLAVAVRAIRPNLLQQVSVTSNGRPDSNLTNNLAVIQTDVVP